MHARKKGPKLGSVHAENEAMKDVFVRCHKETAVQVCTLIIVLYCSITGNIEAMTAVLVSDIGNLTLRSVCIECIINRRTAMSPEN
jgi:hypothetical protein